MVQPLLLSEREPAVRADDPPARSDAPPAPGSHEVVLDLHSDPADVGFVGVAAKAPGKRLLSSFPTNKEM